MLYALIMVILYGTTPVVLVSHDLNLDDCESMLIGNREYHVDDGGEIVYADCLTEQEVLEYEIQLQEEALQFHMSWKF